MGGLSPNGGMSVEASEARMAASLNRFQQYLDIVHAVRPELSDDEALVKAAVGFVVHDIVDTTLLEDAASDEAQGNVTTGE